MSDRGYDSLSRDDAKSMSKQYNSDQAPSKRLFVSEIKGFHMFFTLLDTSL